MLDASSKGTRLAALHGLAALIVLASPAARAAGPAASPAASATPAASAPVAAPDLKGPLIAGICLLSQEGIITQSQYGRAATARVQEMARKLQADLNAEQARLQARGKALEAKRAALPPIEYQAQGEALNQRAQALQAEGAERGKQLDAAKTAAFRDVLERAEPFVAQAYAAHGCGLLLARDTVLAGNLGNDLTGEAVAAFDAKTASVPVPPPVAATPAAPPKP
jgi:Skp family chaperone for outer membrane proteins